MVVFLSNRNSQNIHNNHWSFSPNVDTQVTGRKKNPHIFSLHWKHVDQVSTPLPPFLCRKIYWKLCSVSSEWVFTVCGHAHGPACVCPIIGSISREWRGHKSTGGPYFFSGCVRSRAEKSKKTGLSPSKSALHILPDIFRVKEYVNTPDFASCKMFPDIQRRDN